MAERILNDAGDVELWIKFLRSKKLPMTVSAIDGRDRTGSQNSLQWLWAGEAAQQRGDMTAAEVQREWKLRYGVPILREENPDFRDVYDNLIKTNFSYEEKLAVMDFFEVTSAMKVRQMVSYLDTIQRECAENGIKLTDPDPDLRAYQAKYRAKEAA